jgi:hypothetical protein
MTLVRLPAKPPAIAFRNRGSLPRRAAQGRLRRYTTAWKIAAMPATFRMRLAPGAKLSLTSGGHARLTLGPRATRTHAGASGPLVSTGVGPVQFWTPPARQQRSTPTAPAPQPGSPRTAAKQYAEGAAVGLAVGAALAIGSAGYQAIRDAVDDRRLRQETRAELLEALEWAVVSAHHEDFELVTAPKLHEPEPVDRREVRRQYVTEALEHLPWWRLITRQRGRREATVRADRWSDAEDERRRDDQAARYRRAVERWPGLQVNDPDTVLPVLEEAFADNHAPALALDCADDTATMAVLCGEPGLLPDEKVVRDARGRLRFSLIAEIHLFDDRGAQPEQPRPYPPTAHVVTTSMDSSPREAGTLGAGRRAHRLRRSPHPREQHKRLKIVPPLTPSATAALVLGGGGVRTLTPPTPTSASGVHCALAGRSLS